MGIGGGFAVRPKTLFLQSQKGNLAQEVAEAVTFKVM